MDSPKSEECSAIDGTASGTCAEGYGVCCIGELFICYIFLKLPNSWKIVFFSR